ncbi:MULTISPECIES: STAS domain-containing protein [Actinoplanes]|uniref:STAS domain-containing protein n=1 Tax=Actinoplanes TaxID=1865 RepID=UPI0005F2EB8C|nr:MULTISPECIES: STAS domain-containing protein [Actinoplanes]GLY00490.1 hypothetical protein Acsp01_08690 [Actinoplanes sp. NBRC 101535]
MVMAEKVAVGVSQVRIDVHGGIAFVTVRGDVDRGMAPGLRDVLAWAVDHHDGVVADLSGAGHVDRAGLSVLLQSQDRAHVRACALALAEPSPALRSALAGLQADAMFPMFDHCADAVAWLRTAGHR